MLVHAVVQANSDFVAESTFPKLMFHVSPGAVIPMQAAEWIKANLTNIESVYLGEGGHFIQEHYPWPTAEHAMRLRIAG